VGAREKGSGDYKTPFVIGAAIDLGNCLDLTVRDGLELVKRAEASFRAVRTKSGLPIPKNTKAPKDDRNDNVMRYLDCAVINHLHAAIDEAMTITSGLEPFDTVRALLPEGRELYKGAGFRERAHCQIAVRNPACIKGIFIPLEYRQE
jgi:hypothetical protein